MKKLYQKIGVICILCSLLMHAALAAPFVDVTGIRFSQKAEAVRIVFDLSSLPVYEVKTENNGTRIVIDFAGTQNKSKLTNLTIQDVLVKNISFSTLADNKFRAIIDLNRNAVYKVNTLQNPNRLYIDLIKNYDQKLIVDVVPGIQHLTLLRGNEKGMLTAHFLDIDLAAGYRLRPALANDKIAGREVLSSLAARHQAIGAVNASYFALNGEILGLTMLDSTVVSTTYLSRSAFGLRSDKDPIIGEVDYNGTVTLPNGTVLPLSGVNTERGENALVLYNAYYNASTNSNNYGKEYIIKNNVVTAIQDANSPLLPGTVVLSAHGSSMAQLASVKVGDPLMIKEELGALWENATQIMGVGPTLVKDGSVYLTTKREEFGSDVAGGRAPRTAVGITKDRHLLLAVIDGRQAHSIGCTLLELALLMQEMGAVDAINFDGGGSTEMVLQQEIVNSPSDGAERKIGSALLVLPK